jgi:serine/arginine repetitive matrix protein 2
MTPILSGEWKQMKASNKVPAFPPADLSLKRNKQQKCTNFSANIKKSKIGEDTDRDRHKEGLSKLKALVADTPKKEVVVQTTKGVMKFEGISRKFTRKLYEWEKSKGIGPEASTFALLHPGYRPVVVENGNAEMSGKRERSPGLVRSFSADSIAPNSVLPVVSHHPSSLSLNDADSFMDAASNADPRRISSNPELDLANDLNGQDENDEPEAVLVEVQDFEVETATPLITVVPIVAHEMQPIYKYEPAQNIKW